MVKTFNTIYSNYDDLYRFIIENNISSKNTLVQVFCGIVDKELTNKITREICSILPKVKIIGTTTRAEIFEGKSSIGTCIISITVFNKTEVITYSIKQDNISNFEMGKLLKRELSSNRTKVMILFANGRNIDGEEFLQGTSSILGDVVIAGGIAGRNSKEKPSYIFTEDGIIEDGVVGAALNSDELYVNNDVNFGWIPLGKEHIITDSCNNIIKTIDDIPAVEFYERYMAGENLKDLRKYANQFPLMVKKEGYFACRNIVEIIDNKFIKMNYYIPIGEKVRFGYGNISHIINSAAETCDRVKAYSVQSLFIYSCVMRLQLLKNLTGHEMLPFNNDISVSGFFTNGEFGRIGETNKFLSQTMTILTLSEEKDARISIDEGEFLKEEKSDRLHNKILFNLIKTSSDELEEVNNKLRNKVEEKIDEIKTQYYTDSLTRLPNRLKLIKDIAFSTTLKLALIDINSFNEINDFYGNEIGDRLLIAFGKKVKEFANASNFNAYRVNSDVFAVLTGKETNYKLFIEKINELHMFLKHIAFKCMNQKLFINTSIGMAINEDNLFEKAGMALNYTKMHNKEIQVYYEKLSIVKEYENNLEWIKKLNEAISDDRIVPYFQPIYNNKTCQIEKYEVLIRMIDEDGKIISPFSFLEIARRAHIYPQLTRIMIKKSFDKFKNKNFQFSINLLVEDIFNFETKQLIYSKLKDREIAKKIVFEIVETEGIESFQEVMNFIDTVHGYGGKIAIDDFGTGYSNFKYLTKLNVDYIKIDGSLIKNICNDKTSELVTETIVDFASKLEMDVIAEFVSDKEVFNKIKEMGVDFSQGYYFSEPKPDI